MNSGLILPGCRHLLVLLALLAAFPLRAEILVVVGVRSGIESLSREQVHAVALGRKVLLPGAVRLRIVDQSTTRFIFHDFHRQVTGMSRIRLNAYWARQVFTGAAKAPLRLEGDEAVIAAVSADPELLGYVSALPAGEEGVRVVLRLESTRPSAAAP